MSETPDLDAIMRQAADKIERLQEMGGQLAAVRGTGEAADGLVQVTVLPGGMIDSLDLDPRAMRMPSQDLSEAIVEAIKLAAADASAQAGGQMEEVLPGAGASLFDLADPESVAEGKANSQEAIDSIAQSLRNGLSEER